MNDAVPRRRPRQGLELVTEFNAARKDEWVEFGSECDKFEAEIAKERRIGKLTIAELDEEEQSLDRLRRWYRELRAWDIFTVPEGMDAEVLLKRCAEILDEYANEVYRAVHAPAGLGGALMRNWLIGLAVGVGLLLASWGLLIVLTRRLPPGILRDLARVRPGLPDYRAATA